MFTPGEFSQWRIDAQQLLTDWSRAVPVLSDPVVHRWESIDGQESHTVMAWQGNGYRDHFARAIHDRIRGAIAPERGAWEYQFPFYAEMLADCFRPCSRRFVIDMVIVTPSRVPLRLWQKREPIEEGWGLPPQRPDVLFQQKTVKLIGMSRPLTLNFDSVAWAEFDLKRKVQLNVMNVRIRRRFKAIPFYVQRLFLADFERDVDIVLGEQVPAMLDPHVRGSLVGRVGTGMLQFLRLDDQGQLDVLFLGTSHASGLLTEIRWSNQSFKSIMLSDPYFAPALNEAIRYGRRLI